MKNVSNMKLVYLLCGVGFIYLSFIPPTNTLFLRRWFRKKPPKFAPLSPQPSRRYQTHNAPPNAAIQDQTQRRLSQLSRDGSGKLSNYGSMENVALNPKGILKGSSSIPRGGRGLQFADGTKLHDSSPRNYFNNILEDKMKESVRRKNAWYGYALKSDVPQGILKNQMSPRNLNKEVTFGGGTKVHDSTPTDYWNQLKSKSWKQRLGFKNYDATMPVNHEV